MPLENYIRVMMNDREVLRIDRFGKAHLSKDIDWSKADGYFWEAVLQTLSKEIVDHRSKFLQLEQAVEERNQAIDRLVEENRRLRGLPDGTENEMLDRWSGILDEG